MPVRTANAEWSGNLKDGRGSLSSETGTIKDAPYNAASRFEEGNTTNPEEILGAAHAGCYSMALAHALSGAGFKVNSIKTEDKVFIEKVGNGFTITKIEISTLGDVDGIDNETFQQHAEATKTGCPVSRALTGTQLVLKAKLK